MRAIGPARPSNMPSTISVAQLGARMHYAVPRILYAAGVLERLFTDATATAPWAQILNRVPEQLRPAGLTMLLGRIPKGLPLECISAFERFGWEYALRSRLALGRGQDVETEVHLWAGKKFCQLVLDKGLGQAEGVYTYNSAALELLEHTRQRGNFGILEQVIAPAQVEDSLHAAEEIANPGWESATAIRASRRELASREKSEWENADVILCPSEFVRRGIEECSGPAERCVVVPYGVDASAALCSHKQTKRH